MNYGIGHRRSSHLVLLWLWSRWAVATPIRSLAWELPYATHMALKPKKLKLKICIYSLLFIFNLIAEDSTFLDFFFFPSSLQICCFTEFGLHGSDKISATIFVCGSLHVTRLFSLTAFNFLFITRFK